MKSRSDPELGLWGCHSRIEPPLRGGSYALACSRARRRYSIMSLVLSIGVPRPEKAAPTPTLHMEDIAAVLHMCPTGRHCAGFNARWPGALVSGHHLNPVRTTSYLRWCNFLWATPHRKEAGSHHPLTFETCHEKPQQAPLLAGCHEKDRKCSKLAIQTNPG